MNTTLAERLFEAMQGPPKVTGRALAEACSVSPASVSDWLSGKSKTMEASNLLAAADHLNVRPKWLADGTGGKTISQDGQIPFQAQDNGPAVAYITKAKQDRSTTELLDLFSQLDDAGKREHLIFLRGFVAGRRPHPNGTPSAAAG